MKSFSIIPISILSLLCCLVSLYPSQVQAQQSGEGWQLIDDEELPTMRHENAYTAVGDKLYLLGGRGERPVEVFDPETGNWEKRAAPPLPMHHFQAVSLNDKIYVIGAFTGNYPNEPPVPNVYVYNPEDDSWFRGPEIPEDRQRGAAAAVAYENKIYIVGGIQNGHASGQVRWMDSFDPETGEWTKLPNAPRNRDHFQAAVIDGKLYAAGGRRSSQATGATFELTIPEVDVYDFSNGTWSPLPPSGDLPTERAGSTSLAIGKHLVVIGGESGSQTDAHDEVEAFNTENGEWTSFPSLNVGRHGTQAVLYNGRIFIAAGSKVRGADEINSQEVFAVPDSLF